MTTLLCILSALTLLSLLMASIATDETRRLGRRIHALEQQQLRLTARPTATLDEQEVVA